MTSHILANDILRDRGGVTKNNLLEILKSMDNFDETISSCSESPYIEIENAVSYLKNYKDKFVVLDVNIQSLNAKFDSFTLFLDSLASHGFYFSAICVQETWVNEGYNFDTLHIPNYQTVFLPSTCSSHSGLAIYLHNSYQYKELDLYSSSPIYEGLFLEIQGGGLLKKLTLGNIYRPPRDRNSDLRAFFDLISPILSTITKSHNDCILTGDFNINLLNIESRLLFSEYLDLMYSFSLMPSVNLPTRLSRRNATLIDHIFCKFSQAAHLLDGGIIVSNISDHFMPFICLNKQRISKKPPKTISFQVSDLY